MVLGAGAGILLLLLALRDEGVLVADFGVWCWIVLAAILAGLIGLILGVIFIWGILLSRFAAWIQGWPFKVGDEVVILTGKHRNTVTTVYEIWEQRGQVRVELGEDLKKSVKDVFCGVEVCRNKRKTPNQTSEATLAET